MLKDPHLHTPGNGDRLVCAHPHSELTHKSPSNSKRPFVNRPEVPAVPEKSPHPPTSRTHRSHQRFTSLCSHTAHQAIPQSSSSLIPSLPQTTHKMNKSAILLAMLAAALTLSFVGASSISVEADQRAAGVRLETVTDRVPSLGTK